MSAAALFTHDGSGDYFTAINDKIAGLDPFWRVAAQAAWNAAVGFLETDKLELTIRNATLLTSQWLEGYGLSFLSKGLFALDHLLGVIKRETHSNHRTIFFTPAARLRGSVREPKPVPAIKTKAARPVMIPNVGEVKDATPEEQAAAAAALQRPEGRPPGSPEQREELDRLMQEKGWSKPPVVSRPDIGGELKAPPGAPEAPAGP